MLERLPHRRTRVFGGCGGDAFLREHLSCLRRQRLHGLASGSIRRSAHGVPHHVRLIDAERIHHGDHIVAGDLLRVTAGIGRHVGRRIAALAVADAAMLPAKVAHLRLPAAVIAGIFMDEHDRCAGADRLHIEI